MKAVLIVIGDEILSGNTLDTNSRFITTELKNVGIKTVRILTIPDDLKSISTTLANAFEIADLVITTGGLGPTRDDKTKIALADFFHDDIVSDPATLQHLSQLLEKRNRSHLLDINKGQADVLSRATIFQNDYGTAPCQMIEQGKRILFCLPGVPYEVKPLVKDKIIPVLQERFILPFLLSRIVSVVGIPESLLALKIDSWELALPQNFALSYLPVGNRIKLRITATGTDETLLNEMLDAEIQKLEVLVGSHIIAKDGDRIEEILRDVLTDQQLSISVAESCTGGEVSRLISSIPGSSAYYAGGVCTYQTAKKVSVLKVSQKIIDEYTVVSAEVAQAMSDGCQQLFQTDISVSTTGVAGPASDEFNNEIGVVYYSVRIKGDEKTFRLFLPHLDRGDFMNFVAQKVLQQVVELLVQPNVKKD